MVISSELYTCWFPGSPIRVTLHISLIESLQAIVHATSGDRQGILYGKMNDSDTEVRSSDPLKALSLEEMQQAVAKAAGSAVGYYRIRDGNSLVLTAEEIHIAESVLAKSGSIVLLIERRDTGPEANCFFSERGTILNFPLLEFPLDPVALVRREAQRLKTTPTQPDDLAAAQAAPATVAVPAAAPANAAPVPRRRKAGWLVLASLLLVLAAALFAGLLLNRSRLPNAPNPISAQSQPGALLRAERQGEDLKILWDLSSAAVANATSGVLDIQDGATPRQITMNADQVRFGSVLYSPTSEQVSVRLTTLNNSQPTMQASVLVLLKKTGATPAGAAAQAPVPVSASAPPHARLPVQANTAASPLTPGPTNTGAPALAQPVVPKPESRSATRAFVPPPVKKQASSQADLENSPPLGSPEHAVPVVQLPLGPVAPPPPIAAAPGGPARPLENPRQPASASPAPAGTAPRNEPRKAATDDFVAPALVTQAGVRTPPELPPILKPLAIKVRVGVNQAGKVTRAQALPENGIHSLLLQAAVDAAWKCTFQPARQKGAPVASSVTIVFHLEPAR